MRPLSIFLIFFILVFSCEKELNAEKDFSGEKATLFQKRNEIGIQFTNQLIETEELNPYTYRNFYNGAGVALGDINNDGLIDIYFGGNQVDNQLYLNQGDWSFENITDKAGVACEDVWSSGVTFVDINYDGWLDIYVCKAGPPSDKKNRHNELFINNGDLTFTESAEKYGLDFVGLAVQASFFDYDKDGDLDCYLLNNSIKTVGAYDFIKDQREKSTDTGNKLLRNDNDFFTDVTSQAGIYSSSIGFGLGITISDLNNDGWPDIFVSNDFFERDYLYINQQDGTFSERLVDQMASISMGSMGADVADLDNDSNMDVMVTEMLPKTIERKRTKTLFESWNKYDMAVKKGYHHQFSRNALHRNLGNGKFVELGRMADVSATEWSWASLIFDADNDGLRDIFVSNGIYKDLLDRDYLTYMANEDQIRDMIKSDKEVMNKLVDLMPSEAVPNTFYKNQGNFHFVDYTKAWGFSEPSFSNGSAYADLDNDGDFDLVVNNVNMPAFIYENKSEKLDNQSLSLNLIGSDKNSKAIGAKAEIFYNNGNGSVQENYPSRGFESSVSYQLQFGVGQTTMIDSLIITWPDNTKTIHKELPTDKIYNIDKSGSETYNSAKSNLEMNRIFGSVDDMIDFVHSENSANDFNREQLLPEMFNNEGPTIAKADLNKDGIDDFYIGGAKGQAGALFISNKQGGYDQSSQKFQYDAKSEDTDAIFFDSDGDGDLDLYVCSGGKSFSKFDFSLNDRLYINNGRMNFEKSANSFKFNHPMSSSTVSVSDYDKDGDLDLFVGERFKVDTYGKTSSGFLLVNEGNNNFDVTPLPELENLGLITDSQWYDFNNDGQDDLIVCGEWMPITILINKKGTFENKTETYGLKETSGFWKTMHIVDLNNDDSPEIIAGNKGQNSFFKSGTRMYLADFDNNGTIEQIICHEKDGKYYPILDRDELIAQIPSLKRKFLYYKDYAGASITDIFDEEILNKAEVLQVDMVETTLFKKVGSQYQPSALPDEIQYSTTSAITSFDINDDGQLDLFFGGNQFLVKPQFGRMDASRGWLLFGSENLKFEEVRSLDIEGQIRDFQLFKSKGNVYLMAAINGDSVKIYKRL